jgi:hypothetical protein
MAYELLCGGRRPCPEQTALQLVVDGLVAARACAVQIDDRSRTKEQVEKLRKLRKKFRRLGRCAKRASTRLRADLNRAVAELLRHNPIDAETMQALVEAMHEIFVKHQGEDAARTALSALDSWDDAGNVRISLKLWLEALSSATQRRIENCLSEIIAASRTLTAAEVLFAIAAVLDSESANVDTQIGQLIVAYCAKLKPLWRAAGLRPARARHPEDPSYKSKFHTFAELILTAVVDPWTRRHDGAEQIQQHQKAGLAQHRKLPNEIQRSVSSELHRSDREWLVSEHHLRA